MKTDPIIKSAVHHLVESQKIRDETIDNFEQEFSKSLDEAVLKISKFLDVVHSAGIGLSELGLEKGEKLLETVHEIDKILSELTRAYRSGYSLKINASIKASESMMGNILKDLINDLPDPKTPVK